MAGQLIPWKQYEIGIRSFARAQIPHQWKLWIAGSDYTSRHGNYHEELMSVISESGAQNRIELLGHRQDIGETMRKSSIFLHTAQHEPFGRVILEAMSYELPVVTFADGGPAETVLNGVTGYALPAGAGNALSQMLARLANNPELRGRLGRAGRERVEKLYDVRSRAERMANIYFEEAHAHSH